MAKLIIEENILTLQQTLHTKNNFSIGAVHHVLGKINMAVELKALSWEEAEKYINIIFAIEKDLTP